MSARRRRRKHPPTRSSLRKYIEFELTAIVVRRPSRHTRRRLLMIAEILRHVPLKDDAAVQSVSDKFNTAIRKQGGITNNRRFTTCERCVLYDAKEHLRVQLQAAIHSELAFGKEPLSRDAVAGPIPAADAEVSLQRLTAGH